MNNNLDVQSEASEFNPLFSPSIKRKRMIYRSVDCLIKMNLIICVLMGVVVLLYNHKYKEENPVIFYDVLGFVIFDIIAFLLAILLSTFCAMCSFILRRSNVIPIGCVPILYNFFKYISFIVCIFVSIWILYVYKENLSFMLRCFFYYQVAIISIFLLFEFYKLWAMPEILSPHLEELERDTFYISHAELLAYHNEINEVKKAPRKSGNESF
eukprot:TRINITY_DN12097_c0_g1_i1.p1 TRINITY_DN12097_c0_g1~~TRINITY_DN12097_c0_g1_i1.p1  ORF type:complete len:212 (+),score=54.50 TRINITY_DN12097_c0_g1_i1:117-752(+)